MKNKIIFLFQNKIKLSVKGRNINNFLKRLNDNKINIIKIYDLKHNEATIIIYKDDYDKLMKLKTIYEVTEGEIYGIIKVQRIIDKYKYFLIFFIFAMVLLHFLSNVIFNIEIISFNTKMNKFLLEELSHHGIKKYHMKKSFNNIQLIKADILNRYKDKLEWLEIEVVGTKYVIKFQERIIIDKPKENINKHIVAKKSAIVKKIIASKGSVVKEINQYVKQGEIIISGEIYLYDQLKQTVNAEGEVFGEVWYKVTVEYPFIYSEIKETGNKKDIYVLKILNKEIELAINKYQEKITKDDTLLGLDILPIKLIKQQQRETETISFVLTKEEAIQMAIKEAHKKINQNLEKAEKVIKHTVLDQNIEESKVIVTVFFSILENITAEKEIEYVE